MEIVGGMRDDSHDGVDSSHMIKNGVCEKENDIHIHVMSDEDGVMLPRDKMLISKSSLWKKWNLSTKSWFNGWVYFISLCFSKRGQEMQWESLFLVMENNLLPNYVSLFFL